MSNSHLDDELELIINQQAERIAKIEDLFAFARLREALEPFARFHCSPPGECECHNCQARDVLQRTPADSLAAVRREAMEKARDQMIKGLEL